MTGQFTPRWPRVHQWACLSCWTSWLDSARSSRTKYPPTYLPCYVVRNRAAQAMVDLSEIVPIDDLVKLAADNGGLLRLPVLVEFVATRLGRDGLPAGYDLSSPSELGLNAYPTPKDTL